MSYQKLALKYRPREIDDLIGQKATRNALKGAFKNDRVDSSYLITGPWGSGKTTTARMVATYLNCSAREADGPPCGECDFCVSMTKTPPEHPDYTEINAADTRGIDHIRDLIKGTKFKATTNKRVYVLDECHMLTKQAVEALLKPLEEPSPSAVWILCTTERHKVSQVIASRCTKLNLSSVEPEDIAALLATVCEKENIDLNEEILLQIARASRGHPRDALSILEVAHNTLESGHDFTEESITEVMEEVVQESPEAVVAQFLLSVYKGSVKGAVAAMQEIESTEYFVDKVLTMHEQTIQHFAKCGADPYWSLWRKKVDQVLRDEEGKSLIKLDALLRQNESFLECANMVKGYQVDGYHIVFNYMLRAVQVSRDLGLHKVKVRAGE